MEKFKIYVIGTLLTYLSLVFFNEVFSSTYHIKMVDMSFVPNKLTIKKGDTVIFTNKSNMFHNVVSPEHKIRSKLLKKDEKFEYKFEQKAKVNYYCEPHKAMGMKGEIVVE